MKTIINTLRGVVSILFIVFFATVAKAQYSGTHYIGPEQEFTTIQAAVNSLVSQGVNGAVTMLIKTGTYNEQINVSPIPGASDVNTITIKSETENAEDVMIYYGASGSSNNYVVYFNDCDYVSFEYLKIVNTSTSSYTAVINFNSVAEYNGIRHCKLIGKGGTPTSDAESVIYLNRKQAHNTEISNNEISGGSYSICFYIYNFSTETSQNVKIKYNTCNSYKGVYLYGQDFVQVIGNTINTNYNDGLYLNQCDEQIVVTDNKINSYSYGAHRGIYLSYCSASIAFRGKVYNNSVFVYDDGENNDENYGISLSNCSYYDLYHNTVYLKNSSREGYGIDIAGGASIGLKNNLVSVENNAYAIGNNTTLTECNYNNFFTQGNYIARWSGVNIYTLANLKTTSGSNTNSTDYNPSFISTTNANGLIPQTHWLENTGTNLLSLIPKDIEGNDRTATPDVGAYEFTPSNTYTYSGDLTIKTSGGTFTSFTEAIDSLKKLGISGPVSIIADPKIYNEQISIPPIPGASEINTITITSSTGDSTDVTLRYSSTSTSDNYVIELKSADYVTIKEITIKNTGSIYGRLLKLVGHASYCTVENCVFDGSGNANSTSDRALIVSVYQKPQNLLINNNILKNGSRGIHLEGLSIYDRADLLTISNNQINGGYASIYLNFYSNFEISDNIMNTFTFAGIALEESYTPYTVKNNRLSSNVTTDRGISLYRNSGSGDGGLIYNNFIYIENTSAISGIYLYNCLYVSIYNNSINVVSTNTNCKGVYSYYYSAGSNQIFKNNIFNIKGTGYPFYTNNAVGIIESDYNNFYTSGNNIAYWNGTGYNTVATLAAVSGMDSHSVNFDPVYTTNSDLHTNSYWLDNKGTPITGIEDDIDGDSRDETTPDIGADEYTSTLIPYSGEYIVGSTGRFESFTEAIDSIVYRGVLGPVTFKVQTGYYNEQFTIPQIAGLSQDVTVTFESETGNPEDVTIIFDPGSSNNYIIKFTGGDYFAFKNMSFQSGNTQYSRIFVFEGKCENIEISGNIFQGRSESTGGDADAIIYAFDNSPILNMLTISENTFYNGSYGIYLINSSSTYGEQLIINNNTTNTFYCGIYCKYFSAPTVESNTIELNGADNQGISMHYCNSSSTLGMSVSKNRIYVNNYINSTSLGGIYFNQCNASTTFRGKIVNNEVRAGILNSYRTIAFGISSSSYLDIYYNSVNVNSNIKEDIAFYCNNSTNINVSNNNFSIIGDLSNRNSSFGYAYYINNSTLNVSNFNNYYTSGNYIAYWNGTNCASVASLQAANSKDANSLCVFPAFKDPKLLTTNTPWLDNTGTSIPSVTTDINGNSRSEALPDIGAYEFASTLTPIPSGTYSIGFGGNYSTVDLVVDALMENGIDGPVTFEFLAGSHPNTNLSLKDIPGTSSSDTIVFQSQSGNPSNTVISTIQESSRNHIVKLNGTDYITFRNLTFNSGGSTFGTILKIEGNAHNIKILNNILNGTTYSSDDFANKSSIYIPNNQIVDYLLVQDNTITNNSAGIYFGGLNQYTFNSVKVIGNVFNNQYRQIYFQYTNKPYIFGNELNGGTRYGIYLYYCPNDIKVLNNKVFSSNSNFYGINTYYCDGTAGNKGLIANNFVKSYSTSSYNSYSIRLDYSNYQNVFYNSTMVTGNGAGTAFDVWYGGNIQVVNNIYTNYGTDTYTYRTNNNSAVIVSNYNNFYSTSSRNIRFNSVDYATLDAYKAASFMDLNSMSEDPIFTSSTDFYLLGASPVIGKAIAIPEVVTDMNNETRDLSAPDIGADEFSCVFFPVPVVEDVISCSNEDTPALHAEGTNVKWYSDEGLTDEIWNANDFIPDVSDPGVYTYYVTQADGECVSDAAVVTLTVLPAPELSAVITHIDCQGTSYGSINLSIGGSAGPFNYSWSNGEITQDISNLDAGDYTVEVIDIYGCAETETFTVSSPSEIILEIITQDTECNANMGTATVVASGGESPYSYLWTNGETGTVIDSLYSGVYFVTVTDDLGCTAIGVATINDIGGPEISVESVTDVSCYGGNNGAITLAVSGGATPYQYSWSNGLTTEDISNLFAGQYEIEVTDADGCKAIESILVTEPAPINISLNITQATCGMQNGSVQAVVNGGTSPYSYSWSSGGDNISQLSNLSLGAYSVTVTDAQTCSATKYFAISEIGAPTVIIDSVYQGTCGNSDGAIYISVYGAYDEYTFLWSNGDETEDLVGVEPDTYSVTVSDEGGCDAVQVATIQAEKPATNPICLVSVDSDTNFNEIVWEKEYTANVHHYNIYKEGSQSGVYTLIGSVGVDEESVFTDSLSNVLQRSWRYKLSVVDSCGVESDLSEHHKTMHLTMNLGINNTVNLIWDHYEGFDYSTYYIYRRSATGWEQIAEVPSNLTSYTDFDPIIDQDLFYFIEIVHPYGCDPTKAGRNTSRSNVVHGNAPAQVFPPYVENVIACSNVDIPNLYAEGTDIVWYSDEELTEIVWSGNDFEHGISSPGVYTFYVTQTQSGITSSASVATLTIWPAPVIDASITNIDCSGNDFGSINVSVYESSGPFNYLWSNGLIGANIDHLVAGDYIVQVSDINGCVEIDTFTVTQPSQILLEITTTDTNCGENEGTATVTASGGNQPYSYYWTNGESGTSIDSLYSGIYYVTVVDNSGCSAIGMALINDSGGPEIAVDEIVNVSCFSQSDGSISISISGGNSPYEIIWSNGSKTEDIDNLPAGQYEVEVTDANDCKSSHSFVVEQPEPISITLNIKQPTCGQDDGSVTALVTGGTGPYTYLWSTSGTESGISDLAPGLYNLAVTDNNGCSQIKNFVISETDAPIVIIDYVYHATCGNSDGSIFISVYGDSEQFTYHWSNDLNTEDIEGVEAGTYSVTVTNDSGCSAVQAITVNNQIPEPNPICMVTVDSITNYVNIVWEKLITDAVNSYKIYREDSQGSTFNALGSVAISESSIFVDTVSNPTLRSWRYKLSVVDNCGGESFLSDLHQTMHLSVDVNANSTVSLNWTHYQGFEFDNYLIHRLSNNGWENLGSVSSSENNYTDKNVIFDQNLYYIIEIEHTEGCGDFNSSLSNVSKGLFITDTTSYVPFDEHIVGVHIYPNPNDGTFMLNIETSKYEVFWYSVYSLNGQLIDNKLIGPIDGEYEKRIRLRNLTEGAYMFKVYSKSGSLVKKIIINR